MKLLPFVRLGDRLKEWVKNPRLWISCIKSLSSKCFRKVCPVKINDAISKDQDREGVYYSGRDSFLRERLLGIQV